MTELTIVIPTLGFESIKATIDSILKYKEDTNIEILVIGDVENKLIKKYKKLPYFKHIPIKFEKWDLSLKKNMGFQEAKSNIIAFVDDDATISQNWIKKSLTHFKNKKTGIVSGPGIVPKDANFSMKLFGNTLASLGALPIRKRYKKSKGTETDEWGDKVIGCNMLVRKSVYKKIGGFKEDLKYAEENDYALRTRKAGYQVIMDNELYIYHYARSSFKKFFKQISNFGAAKIKTIKQGVQPFKFLYLLPLLTLIYLPIFIIGSFFSIHVLTILLTFLIAYSSLVIAAAAEATIRTKDLSNLLLIITVPYMHLAYSVGELWEFLNLLL